MIQHIVRAAYSKAHGGTLREQLQDRRNKRLVNIVALVVGAVLFGLSLLSNSAMCTPDINVYSVPPAERQEAAPR